jgi:hypothetical protein
MLNDQGILAAACQSIEFLIPFWYKALRAHCHLPIAFVDLGMSSEAQAFCRDRGILIDFCHPVPDAGGKENVDPLLALRWEQTHGSGVWHMRKKWFCKPFIFSLSPFQKTLWLDLDCEVRSDITPLLSLCDDSYPIALTPEIEGYQKLFQQYGFSSVLQTIYNSGVVPFIKKSSIIEQWIQESTSASHKYISDQDALSALIHKQNIAVHIMPYEMNWDRTQGHNENALIIHWHSQRGKEILKKQIDFLENIGWLETMYGS